MVTCPDDRDVKILSFTLAFSNWSRGFGYENYYGTHYLFLGPIMVKAEWSVKQYVLKDN